MTHMFRGGRPGCLCKHLYWRAGKMCRNRICSENEGQVAVPKWSGFAAGFEPREWIDLLYAKDGDLGV